MLSMVGSRLLGRLFLLFYMMVMLRLCFGISVISLW